MHVSELIAAANAGSPGAVETLFHELYGQLRELARARLRGSNRPALLDTTSLVHESYLRLSQQAQLSLSDRAHFLGYAATVMRSVVVDLVRESRSARRGGGLAFSTLDGNQPGVPSTADEVLEVHAGLEALAKIDPRLVRVVELRYFVGLEMAEIAEAMGVGKRTVERDWEKARSFLFSTLAKP